MKNVYYEGKLIPAKDWDYETKKPKVKAPKAPKKEENPQMAESEDLSIISTEATE
jgi:hypothetical protein